MIVLLNVCVHSDCHFEDALPHFALFIGGATLWTHWNEAGFTPRDVVALCDVGASTKLDRAQAIGQKGVGWKAAFNVSSRPEVHSRSFHFRFDSSSFIIPEPLDETSTAGWPDMLKDLALRAQPTAASYLGTVICLPIDRALAPAAKIDAARLRDELRPEALLFLRKISSLQLHDLRTQTSFCTGISSLVDGGIWQPGRTADAQIVQLHDGGSSSFYYVHSRTFQVPQFLSSMEPRRTGLTHSTMRLAFPLKEATDGTSSLQWQLLPPAEQWLFAFLPVRRVGLRFIVHADWLLVSSREDVHDCAWNSWLRDCVADTFRDALNHRPRALPLDGAKYLVLMPASH
jgi:hypothetical protein